MNHPDAAPPEPERRDEQSEELPVLVEEVLDTGLDLVIDVVWEHFD
jgi:hypothetical protein